MGEPQPTITGPGGRAWLVDTTRRENDPIDWGATLCCYHVNVPGAHPFWSWWSVAMIHLRDVPGQSRPASKTTAAASHELLIVAFDPRTPPSPPGVIPLDATFLSPVDVVEQLENLDDAMAVQLAGLAIRTIVDGRLSPDQDYRRAWSTVLQATAEHLRAGLHRPH